MNILILNETEVQTLLDPDALLEQLSEGFKAQSNGLIDAPNRTVVTVPNTGSLLSMPAYQQEREICVKLVSVFQGNAQLGIPSHQALICLFDPQTGTPLAFMDGNYITALRTAGAAALSTKLLARTDTKVLAIVGAGVQGQSHLEMLSHVRPFSEIRIVSRNFAHAEELAAKDPRARAVKTTEEAVRGADVVSLCTSSAQPVIHLDWLEQGAHVTSVGYAPPGGELASEVITHGRLFVEARKAFDPPPAGCAELAGFDPSIGTELGEVLQNRSLGRQSPKELTVYKAMGHASEDLAAASLIYRRAKQEGVGLTVVL